MWACASLSRRAVPAVSVVLPTYNRAPLLGRSIRSVLGQSYGDFELLVIDDGSTDGTAGVVAAFGDPRVRYVPLARNTGAGAARNVGIRMSRGRFMAFQDSDDEWLPSKLAKQLSAFGRGPSGLGVVYSDMRRVWGDGTETYLAAPDVLPGRLVGSSAWFYQVCDHPLALGPTEADMVVVWKGTFCALEHPTLGRVGPVPLRGGRRSDTCGATTPSRAGLLVSGKGTAGRRCVAAPSGSGAESCGRSWPTRGRAWAGTHTAGSSHSSKRRSCAAPRRDSGA